METIYSDAAYSRSNEELLERVKNPKKYMPNTVDASIMVLKYRGYTFAEEELNLIFDDVQKSRDKAMLVTNKLGFFNEEYKNVIVEDPEAPYLYSRKVIYGFSFLIGPWFSSIMMAINLNRINKFIEPIFAVLFGIFFTISQFFILSFSNSQSIIIFYFFFNFISAYCLDFIFWKYYIGYPTFYRKRSIWVPLIIAILFISIIIALLILQSFIGVD